MAKEWDYSEKLRPVTDLISSTKDRVSFSKNNCGNRTKTIKVEKKLCRNTLVVTKVEKEDLRETIFTKKEKPLSTLHPFSLLSSYCNHQGSPDYLFCVLKDKK